MSKNVLYNSTNLSTHSEWHHILEVITVDFSLLSLEGSDYSLTKTRYNSSVSFPQDIFSAIKWSDYLANIQ